MKLSEDERRALAECWPALKRDGSGFHRAPKSGRVCRPKIVAGPVVRRLVEAGLLRWVNACRSAAVLTEEGRRARDDSDHL